MLQSNPIICKNSSKIQKSLTTTTQSLKNEVYSQICTKPEKVNECFPCPHQERILEKVTVWSTSRPGSFTPGGRIHYQQHNSKPRQMFHRAVAIRNWQLQRQERRSGQVKYLQTLHTRPLSPCNNNQTWVWLWRDQWTRSPNKHDRLNQSTPAAHFSEPWKSPFNPAVIQHSQRLLNAAVPLHGNGSIHLFFGPPNLSSTDRNVGRS
jgi:hypothetical protein